jgi:hypothetical protein
VVELGRWGEAERQSVRYLDRANDDAWCIVWFQHAKGLLFGYYVGNKQCVFPQSDKPPRERTSPKASDFSSLSAMQSTIQAGSARTTTTPGSAKSAKPAPIPDSSGKVSDDEWLSEL